MHKVRKLEPGYKLNRWTVIKPDLSKIKSHYICQCDCGVIKSIDALTLRNSRSKSCGCIRRPWVSEVFRKNQIGKIINRLTIIEVLPKSPSSVTNYYRVLCSCGTIKKLSCTSIHTGHTKSCGCLSSESARIRATKYEGNPAFNLVYLTYKNAAARNERIWDLSRDQVQKLFDSNCFYCGLEPSNRATARKWQIKYSGLDRKDNNIGYIVGNVVPCCKICNLAKRTLSEEEFIEWIKRVHKNLVNTGRINEKDEAPNI